MNIRPRIWSWKVPGCWFVESISGALWSSFGILAWPLRPLEGNKSSTFPPFSLDCSKVLVIHSVSKWLFPVTNLALSESVPFFRFVLTVFIFPLEPILDFHQSPISYFLIFFGGIMRGYASRSLVFSLPLCRYYRYACSIPSHVLLSHIYESIHVF